MESDCYGIIYKHDIFFLAPAVSACWGCMSCLDTQELSCSSAHNILSTANRTKCSEANIQRAFFFLSGIHISVTHDRDKSARVFKNSHHTHLSLQKHTVFFTYWYCMAWLHVLDFILWISKPCFLIHVQDLRMLALYLGETISILHLSHIFYICFVFLSLCNCMALSNLIDYYLFYI
jgi:hypothetical protein